MICRSSACLYTAICEYINIIDTRPRCTRDTCSTRTYELPYSLPVYTHFIEVTQELAESGYPSGRLRNTIFVGTAKRGWQCSWLTIETLRLAELWIEHTQ